MKVHTINTRNSRGGFTSRIVYTGIIRLLLLILLTHSSCKVHKIPVGMPAEKAVPATFTGSADSLSAGDIPWQSFFADQYLTSLIDTALRNNPDLQIAVQRVEIARAFVLIGRGALLPSLNLVGSAGVDKFGEYTLNGVGNFDTNLSEHIQGNRRIPTPTPDFFLGLRSSWELDIWGKLRSRRRAAYARFLASEKGKQAVQTALVAQVASLYYNLLALDSELEIIRRNIGLQETGLEMVTVQKQGGRATELAVQQFNAQLLRTRSLEYRINQDIIATETQLNSVLGRFPQPIRRGRSLLEQEIPAQVSAGIPAAMLSRRPDVQQAEFELAAASADVTAARAAFLPSLTITPYAGLNAFDASLLFVTPASLAYGVLAGLSAPLFNNNQIRSGYKQAIAGNREAHYAYQKAVLTGYQEVVVGLRGIQNLENVYQLNAQEVDVLRQAVTTSNDLFGSGFATYLEIVTAQRSALEAELGLINTRKEQFLTLIDLYRALGGGWR